MPRQGPDPLTDTTLLLVDGSNLLHALRRGPGALPAAALIGRLRAAIPATASIELHLDGAPEPGMRRERVASGLTVRYSAPISADAAILDRVSRMDPVSADGVLVVTDDRDLRFSLERRGARTARSRWLVGRLERIPLAAPVAGNPRPGPGQSAGDVPDRSGGGDDGDEQRWRPGRGATVKRGNPSRRRRATR